MGVPLYSDTVMTHFRIHCLQNWIFVKFSHSIVLGALLGPPRSVIDLDVVRGSHIKIFSKVDFVRVQVLVLAPLMLFELSAPFYF